jgi:hypothetical protein
LALLVHRDCVRYPTAEERAQKAEAIAIQERNEKLRERSKNKKLVTYLISLGIDPDEIL